MVVGLGVGVVLRGRFGGSFEVFNVQRTYNIVQHAYNTRTTYVQHAHYCTQVWAGEQKHYFN